MSACHSHRPTMYVWYPACACSVHHFCSACESLIVTHFSPVCRSDASSVDDSLKLVPNEASSTSFSAGLSGPVRISRWLAAPVPPTFLALVHFCIAEPLKCLCARQNL